MDLALLLLAPIALAVYVIVGFIKLQMLWRRYEEDERIIQANNEKIVEFQRQYEAIVKSDHAP